MRKTRRGGSSVLASPDLEALLALVRHEVRSVRIESERAAARWERMAERLADVRGWSKTALGSITAATDALATAHRRVGAVEKQLAADTEETDLSDAKKPMTPAELRAHLRSMTPALVARLNQLRASPDPVARAAAANLLAVYGPRLKGALH